VCAPSQLIKTHTVISPVEVDELSASVCGQIAQRFAKSALLVADLIYIHRVRAAPRVGYNSASNLSSAFYFFNCCMLLEGWQKPHSFSLGGCCGNFIIRKIASLLEKLMSPTRGVVMQ